MKCPYCLVPLSNSVDGRWACHRESCRLGWVSFHPNEPKVCYLCRNYIYMDLQDAGVVIAEGINYYMHEACRLKVGEGAFV